MRLLDPRLAGRARAVRSLLVVDAALGVAKGRRADTRSIGLNTNWAVAGLARSSVAIPCALPRSGDPYVVHPLSVASIIAELRLDVPSLCAGLLHDCVEDTSSTVEELQQLFGSEVAFLVDGVTKLGKISWTMREERQA